MKKIIGIIHPFDIYQTLYVYEDGNKLEITQVKMGEIPDTIFDLSKTYNINQIDLSGAQHFTKGIIKKIQQEEIIRYNKNELIIRCI